MLRDLISLSLNCLRPIGFESFNRDLNSFQLSLRGTMSERSIPFSWSVSGSICFHRYSGLTVIVPRAPKGLNINSDSGWLQIAKNKSFSNSFHRNSGIAQLQRTQSAAISSCVGFVERLGSGRDRYGLPGK